MNKNKKSLDRVVLHSTSKRATSIAKILDRLDPGIYNITLEKSNDGFSWLVRVNRMMPIVEKRLPKIS